MNFDLRLKRLKEEHASLITRTNIPEENGNGIFERYRYPVLTALHTPLYWRYDLSPATNPYLMERFGINAVFNAGAIRFGNKYALAARVEGADRKSFFAIAESENGTDNFVFRKYPIQMPSLADGDTNLYDIRLVQHQDGWIYGIFCTEQRDPAAAP
ncbi:MAG TPA: glycosidase, partial [Pseudobacter sp.]|nr:glycosidase [Pseudobacter sp.]